MSQQRVRSLSHFFLPGSRGLSGLETRTVHNLPRGKRAQIAHLSDQVADLKELLSWLVAAMVVTDQPTAAAANAYEGLRSSVIQASRDRNRLLVTLASLDHAFCEQQDVSTIHSKIEEEMARTGLKKSTDTSNDANFDFENDRRAHFSIEVIKPAYVDGESGALVRTGTARWIEVAPPVEPMDLLPIEVVITAPHDVDAVPSNDFYSESQSAQLSDGSDSSSTEPKAHES